MFGNPFGGLFDFNRDGKTDAFEMGLGLNMIHEAEKSAHSNNNTSYGFTDDGDEDLELAGLSRLDLELMDSDERRATLEEAGLDPDDFEAF